MSLISYYAQEMNKKLQEGFFFPQFDSQYMFLLKEHLQKK